MSDPGAEELLDVALEAARAAAEVLVAAREQVRGREIAIGHKSTATDPVSEADLAAERAIREVLARRRPGDAILGEEGGGSDGETGIRWVVDPLDGTVNYLYGHPQWCVSVACEGRAGVVLDPLRDECFTAVPGGGAFLGEERLQGSRRTELGRSLVATGFGYDTEVRRVQGAQTMALLPDVRDIRRAGSAALDLAWTAAGRHDAYFERGVQPWDVAAGLLLCTEAGLEVHPLAARDGLPAGVLVAAPGIAADLLERVA